MQNASFFYSPEMKNYPALFLFLFFFSSCINQHGIAKHSLALPLSGNQISDTTELIIRSTNLSEDMSTLSSNDDEVMLLLYNFNDSLITAPPVLSTYFVLTKKRNADTLYSSELNKHKNMILFLLEIDSNKTLAEIETLVSAHYKDLISASLSKNYPVIQRCIGDDDILGIREVSGYEPSQNLEIIFSDIYRMDRYDYSVTLKPKLIF
jgi:hypothetical protein